MSLVEVWMFLMSVSAVTKLSLLSKPLPPSRLRLALISPFHTTSLHVFLPHISISYHLLIPSDIMALIVLETKLMGSTMLLLFTFLDIDFVIVILGLS